MLRSFPKPPMLPITTADRQHQIGDLTPGTDTEETMWKIVA